MFEGVVSQVIAGYLGRYIKGIQKDQLKIGIWNEEVLLENVELILEAFDYLRFPFALKNGRVGNLSIKIPWKRLGWDPIIVVLNDVFICASQREEIEWSADSVEKRELAGKIANLNAIELAKFSKRVSSNQAGSSFISYISAKVLDSIQVSIHNVHIMYIDSHSEMKFMLGLRFSSLTVMTDARKNGSKMSLAGKSRSADVIKIVEMSEVCLYCRLCEEIQGFLDINLASNAQFPCDVKLESDVYDYLVEPFDATVYLLANKAAKADGDPQYSLSAELDTLVISLSEVQLREILSLLDYLSICSLREKYGKYRPSSSSLTRKPVGWQRMWWHYAQNSILADVRAKLWRSSWRNLARRLEFRRKYVKLYRRKLERLQQDQSVEKDILLELENLDRECDINDILYYRSIAEQQDLQAPSNSCSTNTVTKTVAYEKQPYNESRARSWLNFFSLGMLGVGGTSESNSFAGVVSDDIIKDICEAAEYHPNSSYSGDISKKDGFRLIYAKLTINKVIGGFKSIEHKISEFIFEEFHIEYEVWDDCFSCIFVLNAMKIINPCKGNVVFTATELVDDKLTRQAFPFLDVHIMLLPSCQNQSLSVKVELQPFEAAYDSDFLQELLNLIHVVKSHEFQRGRVLLSLNGIENFKIRLLAKSEQLLDNRRKIKWDAVLHNAAIQLPLNNEDGGVVIIETGSLLLKSSALMEFNRVIPESISAVPNLRDVSDCLFLIHHGLYDAYEIELHGLQVKLRKSSKTGFIPVFDKVDASARLRRCFFQDEPMLKPLEIDFVVPLFHLYFSPQLHDAFVQMHGKWPGRKSEAADMFLADSVKLEKASFTLSAKLESVRVKIDLEDETVITPVVLFNFGSTNIRCSSEEQFEFWMVSDSIKVDGLQFRDDLHILNICSSKNSCSSFTPEQFQGCSSESCSQLHYHARQNGQTNCHVFDIFIGESDLQLYPVVFLFLDKFFDRIRGNDESFSATSNESFEREMVDDGDFETEGITSSNFGVSNFYDTNVSICIPLDCFPFVGMLNPSLNGCVEDLMLSAPKFKNLFRNDRHCSKSPTFNITKCFGITSNKYKELQSCFEKRKLVRKPASFHAYVLNINLRDIQLHLHDTSCVLGTFTVPMFISSLSFGGDGCWKFVASIDGLLFSSSWFPYDICRFLLGPTSSDVTAVLNVCVRKMKRGLCPLNEICIGIQNMSCILTPDYLSLIVGYFTLPDWSSDRDVKQTMNLQRQEFSIIVKCEILDSSFIFPLEQESQCALRLDLPQLYVSYIPSSNLPAADVAIPAECKILEGKIGDRIDLVNLYGRKTSLSILLLEDDVEFTSNFHTCNRNGNRPIISHLDADFWIRMPCRKKKVAKKSSLVMVKVEVCDVNVGDEYFFHGCEQAIDVIDKFSSVRKESELFESDVLQFLELKKSIKEGTVVRVDILQESLISMKFSIASLCIKLYGIPETATKATEMVAKIDMQLKLSALLQNDTLRSIDADIPQLIISSSQTFVPLALYASDGSISSVFYVKLYKSSLQKNELRISVSCLNIWLHLSYWKEVFDLLYSYSSQSGNGSCLSSESGDNSLDSTPALLESINLPCVTSECSIKDETWLLLVSDNIEVSFHFPVAEKGEGLKKSETSESSSYCLLAPISIGERSRMSSESVDMYVKVVVESRYCEVIFGKQHLKFKSNIEILKTTLESTQNDEVWCLQFIQISKVKLASELFTTLGQSHSIEVDIKNIDVRLSYQILKFWSRSCIMFPEAAPSQTQCHCLVTKVHLDRSSLLLSDGRLNPHGPILEMLMGNMRVEVKKSECVMDGFFSADLLINCNNTDKVTWEPILEPWSFHLRMLKKEAASVQENSSPLTDIYLMSSGQLKLNVTEPSIESVFWGCQVLMDALSKNEEYGFSVYQEISEIPTGDETHIRSYAPYILCNDTCLPLKFNILSYLDIENYTDHSYEDGCIVQPGSCVPIYIKETLDEQFFQPVALNSSERLTDRKANDASHHMITMQFEGTSSPSKPMSMDLVGLTYFEVNFSSHIPYGIQHKVEEGALSHNKASQQHTQASSGGLVVPVVFEVTKQHLSKIIHVYSTVILFNATSVTLEIRFDIPFGVYSKKLDPILPGQEFPLPLHLAESGRIRWRPSGVNLLWSEVHSLSNILSQGNRPGFPKSFVCYPRHPSSDPFRCCIAVQEYDLPVVGGRKFRFCDTPAVPCITSRGKSHKLQNAHLSRTYFLHQVKLITPFLVKNYLPVGLSVTLSSPGVRHSLFLDEADVASIFFVDSSNDLTITLDMRGFRLITLKFPRAETFATMAKFNAPKFLLHENITFISDASSVPICVNLLKEMNSFCGARELSMSVPFLLYNSTGFPLSIIDRNNERKGSAQVIPPSYSLVAPKLFTEKNGLVFFSCNQESSPNFIGYKGFVNPLPKLLNKISHGQPLDFSDAEGSLQDSSKMKSSTYDVVDMSAVEIEEMQNLGKDKLKACMYAPVGHNFSTETWVRLCASLPNCGGGSSESVGWSNPFSLVPSSGSVSVIIPLPCSSSALLISATSISVPVELSGRTKAIAFQPRYIICNTSSKDLDFKQRGASSYTHLIVGQHSHLHWFDTTRDLLVSIRFSEPGWQWSGGFLPDRLGDTQLKMINNMSSASRMVRVEVQNANIESTNEANIHGSHGNSVTRLILLSDDETGFMPYRIDNFSMERLRIYQKNCQNVETIVDFYSSHKFTWDEPCYPHRLVVEVPGERVLGTYNLDVTKDFAPVYLPSTFEKPERRLHVSIYSEGAIKVLNIVDSFRHIIKKMKDSGFLGLGEKKQVDLKQNHYEGYREMITLHFPFIGISLIDSIPQELLFACAKETTVVFLRSLDHQKISLHISFLQIDNQLPDTPFPVMLSFDNEQKSQSAVSLTASKWRKTDPSLSSFKHFNLRLSPIHIELEQQMILTIFEFFKTISSRLRNKTLKPVIKQDPVDDAAYSVERFWIVEKGGLAKGSSLRVSDCVVIQRNLQFLPCVVSIGAPWQQIYLFARRQKKIYIEILDLAPIKLFISFASIPWMNRVDIRPEVENLSRVNSTSFQRGLMALIDVEGVPVHLSQLLLEHLMASPQSIQEILVGHYTRQLLHELYKIFGSAGVIGNPLGFARNVRMGIEESLSVYSRGVLQSPSGIFAGMLQGSTSLLTNTIYAISSATTQFTKSAHKGIMAFAFDAHGVTEMDEGPKGSPNRGVLNELFEGLTGLLQSPIRGAEKNGLLGVVTGIAMGTAGLVARPMASILEATGQTAQSIRTRSGLHLPSRLRVRLPRPLASGVPLSPYSWEESIGISLLLQAEGSRRKDEKLVICKRLGQDGFFAVVTESSMLDAGCPELSGFNSPEFSGVPAELVWSVRSEIALESVIHVDRAVETVNVVGNNPLPSNYGQRRRGGGNDRNRPWKPPMSTPLFQMSLEFPTPEDAEDFLQVLLFTIQQWKEQRKPDARILHRRDLK